MCIEEKQTGLLKYIFWRARLTVRARVLIVGVDLSEKRWGKEKQVVSSTVVISN